MAGHKAAPTHESSLLRRVSAIYTPSVPEGFDDDGTPLKVPTLADYSDTKRRQMASNMASVAMLLESRRIVPSNPDEHRQLAERELSALDTSGPASISSFRPLSDASGNAAVITPGSMQLFPVTPKHATTATYDLLEFADILSHRERGSRFGDATHSTSAATGHTHDVRQTLFKSMAHQASFVGAFRSEPMFAYKLFGEQSASLATLLMCPQHDTLEQWLDQFRCASTTEHTIADWVELIYDQCGLPIFCAYASDKSDDVTLVVTADNSSRYFALVVLARHREPTDTRKCIELASTVWNTAADEEYTRRMNNTDTVRDTLKPCAGRFGSEAKPHFWVIYDVGMCEPLLHTRFSFQYAYYTACQCVNMNN